MFVTILVVIAVTALATAYFANAHFRAVAQSDLTKTKTAFQVVKADILKLFGKKA